MKFLIVAPRFHTNLYYRAKALQEAGHSVKLVVLYKGNSEFYENILPLQVELSTFSKLIINVFSFFKKCKLKSSLELRFQSPNKELRKVISNYKPGVILLKAYQNALAIKTLRIAKKKNIKVLMLTQTNLTHIKGSKFLFKLNINYFKFLKVWAYITPIKSNYDAFKKAGINNIYYLPFVFPYSQKTNKNNNEKIKILSIGKFQKRKDQLALLKAFEEVKKEGYKISLCLIGERADENYYQSINNYVSENNLLENVCIKTNTPYLQVLKEYKKHDIFILPAYSEPAAYSPVEALANGLPVICSNENGTKSYIKDSKNGYIFEAKNKNDLKQKIKLLVSDKENLLKMKENALLSAKENHNPDFFAKKILEIIK